MSAADDVIELFKSRGQQAYFGEDVSVLEHSLQTASLALAEGATDQLITAALVHDVGHLVHELPEDIASQGIDGRHEVAGERWLRARFGQAITEPVRLHVDAKRYLCATDPTYLNALSPSSLQSLALQGGPFSIEEAQAFEKNPFYREAVTLRRWDDRAKDQGLEVPGLETYRENLDRAQ